MVDVRDDGKVAYVREWGHGPVFAAKFRGLGSATKGKPRQGDALAEQSRVYTFFDSHIPAYALLS